jgi:hypothetical protein
MSHGRNSAGATYDFSRDREAGVTRALIDRSLAWQRPICCAELRKQRLEKEI